MPAVFSVMQSGGKGGRGKSHEKERLDYGQSVGAGVEVIEKLIMSGRAL
jgi:hypothetical protein